jgi:hypothetical protein
MVNENSIKDKILFYANINEKKKKKQKKKQKIL